MTSIDPQILERLTRIRSHYVTTARFQLLSELVDEMVLNVELCKLGIGSKHRAHFVIGESGTGKTRAFKEIFATKAAFQSRFDDSGRTVVPFLSMEAPSPCSTKHLAVSILNRLGLFPKNANSTSTPELYELVGRHLKKQGIVYLHIDEMQRTVKTDTKKNIENVQENLVSLTQIDDWPLHLFISGVPELKKLLDEGDKQLSNRSKLTNFDTLNFENDTHVLRVQEVFQEIMRVAGLQPSFEIEGDFCPRLIVSASGSLGTLIHDVQSVCFKVILSGERPLTITDFARNYFENKSCLPADNPFTSDAWKEVNPDHATSHLDAEEDEDKFEKKPRKRRTRQ